MRIRTFAPILIGLAIFGFFLVPAMLAAQGSNGIAEPEPGEQLSGVVVVNGTATDPSFLRYELAFRQLSGFQSDWIVFAQGDQAVIDDTLAVWDTTVGGEANPVFPDGAYQLRLRVVRTDYNYDEYFVSDLIVSNFSPTPTVTPTLTVTATLAATPVSDAALQATRQAASGVLPTLTPFPTPSAPAVPEGAELGAEDRVTQPGVSENAGLAEQISSVDTGRFSRAFVVGGSAVAVIFCLMAIYLLIRMLGRRVRKQISNRGLRQN